MHLYVDSRYTSPYAMSVFVALHEKQLPFDITTIDLSSDAAPAPAYAELSLTRRMPTLVDGDFALSESSTIMEYSGDEFQAFCTSLLGLNIKAHTTPPYSP